MARSWPFLPWRPEPPTPAPTELGRRAERAAARYLQRRGLRLIARNYRTRVGEIDLVMTDGSELVFIEVRFRSRADFGDGAETIDQKKQQRIARAARHYLLHRTSDETPCRFDVVSVSRTNYLLRFEWIQDAFTP